MSQIYSIDETKINNIKKRGFIRIGKIFILVLIMVYLPEFFKTDKTSLRALTIACVFTSLVMFLTANNALNRLVKSYKTLQIILSDDGVEIKAEMMPYKRIGWSNLKIEEKRNGTIILDDISYSIFSRKWNGKGRIFVQPEIINREQLLLDLHSHLNKYDLA